MTEYIYRTGGAFGLHESTGEEIVRCRDCAYSYTTYWPVCAEIPPEFLNCQGPLVTLWDYEADQPKMNPVEPDGYCAWGERRDGNDAC